MLFSLQLLKISVKYPIGTLYLDAFRCLCHIKKLTCCTFSKSCDPKKISNLFFKSIFQNFASFLYQCTFRQRQKDQKNFFEQLSTSQSIQNCTQAGVELCRNNNCLIASKKSLSEDYSNLSLNRFRTRIMQ
jgi:hypothetical protein